MGAVPAAPAKENKVTVVNNVVVESKKPEPSPQPTVIIQPAAPQKTIVQEIHHHHNKPSPRPPRKPLPSRGPSCMQSVAEVLNNFLHGVFSLLHRYGAWICGGVCLFIFMYYCPEVIYKDKEVYVTQTETKLVCQDPKGISSMPSADIAHRRL